MGIQIGYTPFQAVGEWAQQIGRREGQRQDDEFAFRQQQAANQLGMQQAQLDQQAAMQDQRLAYGAMERQAENVQRAQYQAAQARDHDLTRRFGLYGRLMGQIADDEQKGFQYTPDQNKRIAKLDQDMEFVRNDPAAGPEQKAYAEQEYYAQRSTIRPRMPAPKTKQQILDESVAHYTFPDGTTVPMVVGERNGMPDAKPIENPAKKDAVIQQKAEFEREKWTAAQQMNAQKLDNAILKSQNDQMKWERESQQKQVDQEEQMRFQRVSQFNTEHMKHLADIGKLMLGVKDPSNPDGGTVIPHDLIKKREEMFRKTWGQIAAEVAPDVAADWGVKPRTFTEQVHGNSQGMIQPQQPQATEPQAAPYQQEGPLPTITQPEVAANLPSGYRFIGSDGKVHRVP